MTKRGGGGQVEKQNTGIPPAAGPQPGGGCQGAGREPHSGSEVGDGSQQATVGKDSEAGQAAQVLGG